jgi:hypothetical protein
MEEQLEEKGIIYYKIMPDYKYRVYKSVNANGKIFYKITSKQKNMDGTTFNTYTEVFFKKGCGPKDITDTGIDIIIKKGMENRRKNPNDKYHDISSLTILEYEQVKRDEEIKAEALDTFNTIQQENEIENNEEYLF